MSRAPGRRVAAPGHEPFADTGPVPRRAVPARDRRGRGMRGQVVLPGPLTPRGVPLALSARDRFDVTVADVVAALEDRWAQELGSVEFVIEEVPVLPDDWAAATVPLASVVRGEGSRATRLALFRRPIELRCETDDDLGALILTVLVEQVSELLGRAPEEIHPGYEAD